MMTLPGAPSLAVGHDLVRSKPYRLMPRRVRMPVM